MAYRIVQTPVPMWPDRDGDGVNDEEDKCPDIAGDPTNHGCPLVKEEVRKRVNYAAQHIFFATALSDHRAGAVKAYLLSKGIAPERIFSLGHGPSNPIDDNKTAAGRARNRRVEMKLDYL